ncbi:MAG: hypothetical protein K2M48_04755, partial [Clostridiales bacterium]|nr:hypothetical protein [Clostridiales bacterium]
TLQDTDGVFQCYRTVYRTVTDNAEVSVEIIAPPTDGSCAVKVSVINRTAKNASVSAVVSYSMSAHDGADIEVKHIKNAGMALTANNYEVGLCSDAPCEYDVKNAEGTGKTMSAERRAEIGAFSAVSVLFAIVADKKINAVRLSQFEDSTYFARSVTASKAYYRDNYNDLVGDDFKNRFAMRNITPDKYDAVRENKIYVYERGAGGFTDNGYCAAVDTVQGGRIMYPLFDGELFVEATADGDSVSYAPDGSEFNGMNVVLCENGVVWSPFGALSGEGATCELCCGYVEYKSVRNGCVATLTRTLARGKRTEVLLLTVENRTDDNRNIDVMLTSQADTATRVVVNSDKIYALGNNGFVLFSSEPPSEFCKYKEGYLDHGRIARASHFESGGETPAPTLSVALESAPHAVTKVAFCRAALSGGVSLDGITVDEAERLISAEREYYSKCGRIALNSSDPALNAAYSASLYCAHAHLHKYMRIGRYDKALMSCFAVKYADADLVCDTVLGLCEKQESCGRLDVGRKTPIATLLLPLVAIDFVNFCGDCRLLGENVGFRSVDGITAKPASVLEHCFRAIDFSILVSTRIDEKTDKAFSALLLRAVRAFLEYSAHSDRVKAYSSVAARLSLAVGNGVDQLAAADIEFDPLGVATAYARYEVSDSEFAYKAVKELTDKALQDENGLPRLFSSPDGVAAALFYVLVTEKLLGISVRGDKARISPNTASNTPHIEFCISSEDGEKANVLIDDGEVSGGWQINLDRISIASDTIKISEAGERIVMRRSGRAS